MILVIEENPNCAWEERVFAESGEKRQIESIRVDNPAGQNIWCTVTGVDEDGKFIEAKATRVEDSSDGTAWLIYGGNWGIRFRPADSTAPWSLEDKTQWGTAFKVLDASAVDIKFKGGN